MEGGSLPASGTGWPDWADPLAVQRLRDALRTGNTGHAYLLSGPKGVGKAALALAFSQALVCTNIEDRDLSQPCGECRACRNVVRGAHPDVEWFTLESQAMLADKPGSGASISIDTVRRLRASATLLPLEGVRRVLIVDDAETLLEPAQQALLKTLEEPPPTVTLLLLTDEQDTLLETVRSRCQQVVVRPVAPAMVEQALVRHGIEAGAAAEIARLSRGCPAWAIAAASDAKILQSRRAERESAASWIGSPHYDRLITAFRLGDQFTKRRAEVVGVVQAAVQLLREAMLREIDESAGNGASDASFNGDSVSPLALSRAIRASMQCLADLDANVRPKLALEAMVLAWPSMELRQA